MFQRTLADRLRAAAAAYPIVAVLGPRQSGKTTLVRATFPDKPYVSLENPDLREFASSDPRRFLRDHSDGAILDEVQRAPELLSYLQQVVDDRPQPGLFVLTGSQNLLVLAAVTQSLAGRVSLNTLLPLAVEELAGLDDPHPELEELLFAGFYPRIWDRELDPTDWIRNYVETYVERDVRQIQNVGDLTTFARFVRHCAARSGQALNLSSLGNDCGISHNTAKSWLSILEASYVVHLVGPFHRNLGKRLRRTPKLYFYDTGLVCYLLGLRRADELRSHANRGAVFETFVLGEILKRRVHRGLNRELWFWQDQAGNEVDCLWEVGTRTVAMEVKSGATVASDYFKNLRYWQTLSGASVDDLFVVYAGTDRQRRSEGTVVPWRQLDLLPL